MALQFKKEDVAQVAGLNGGIQEVLISKASIIDINGKDAISLDIEGKVGEDDAKSTVNIFLTSESDDVKYQTGFQQKLTHIIAAYKTKKDGDKFEDIEAIVTGCDTLKELAEATVEVINEVKIPIKLKLVFNKSGYLGLPNFPDFISSDLNPCELWQNKKYDFFTKEDASTSGGAIKPDAPKKKF